MEDPSTPSKTQSILLGGAITGVIVAVVSLIPVLGSCLACLGYAAAGVVAVWHYTNTNALTVASGSGAGMGAMAGVVAVLLGSLLSYFMMMSGLAPTFEDVLQQMADSGQMPDEQFEVIEGIFNSPLIYVAFLGVGSVIGAIMGAIGGAVGASIFKKGGEFPS